MARRVEASDRYQRGDVLYPKTAEAIALLEKAIEFYDDEPCEQLLMAVLGCARTVVKSGRRVGKEDKG